VLKEIFLQSWDALRRNPTRSMLTMLGIVWGIAAVTLLMAYGAGFREILSGAFYAFGRSAVVGWPGQTSLQAGGERAGKRVRLEKEDLEFIKQDATLESGVPGIRAPAADELRGTHIGDFGARCLP